MIVAQVGVMLAALAIESHVHESIIYSGPIFAATGLCIAVMAYRQRDVYAVCFGVSAVGLTLLVVTLINFYGWGPSQGDLPITRLSLAYAAIAIPVAVWLFLHNGNPAAQTET